MIQDLSSWTRIGIDSFKELTSFRGHPAAFETEYQHATDISYYSALFLPVHGLTHLDFPWREGRVDPRLVDFYCQPASLDTIILDFTHLKAVLSPYLLQDDRGFLRSKTTYPLLDTGVGRLKDEDYWLLVQELEIRREKIEDKLEELSQTDLKETLLLFWTDWPSFNRHEANFNHPALEGIAAYLFHPYLAPETVNWLVDEGCIGLGHDVPSLEHPLLYARGAGIHPLVRKAREFAYGELTLMGVPKQDNPLEERAIYNRFLKLSGDNIGETEPRRYYLRNLRMNLLGDSPFSTSGLTSVIPIPVLKDRAAVACEAFFQRLQ